MKCVLFKRWVTALFAALAGGFCFLFYFSLLLKKNTLWFALGYAAVTLLACLFLPRRPIAKLWAALHGLGLVGSAAIFAFISLYGGRYAPVQGSYTQSFYAAPQKVMFVVPHPDDDLNLAAGVIDSYRQAGTSVKVVYLSNGDAEFKTAYRLREALRCQQALGVPARDVVFLGYGDQYTSPYGHIYNAPPAELLTSDAGYTHTYGLKEHPEYRFSVSDGWADYTHQNVVWDLQELLGRELPDVIYCADQDFHPDHRGTSLIFEEALGNILGSGASYHPTVYKGFGYSTAWMAQDDYQALNTVSTLSPTSDGRMEETNCYLWANRVRLPVLPQDLAYTRAASRLYPAFASYGSQKAVLRMGRVINGDKVFWARRTDSLLYTASFSAQNMQGLARLNDFKLADSVHIAQREHRPFDGVWIPAPQDLLLVRLAQPALITQLTLYDNPSLQDNVLQTRITMDTGEELLTGPLEPGGSATLIPLPHPVASSSFTVEFLKTEGERAGLCELEAYSAPQQKPVFIKLTDAAGNFLYTYTPENQQPIELHIYESVPTQQNRAADLNAAYTVTAADKPLMAQNGAFLLPCPQTGVTVRLSLKADPTVYDEIFVKPYSVARQHILPLLCSMDELYSSYIAWCGYHWSHLENTLLSFFHAL